MFSKLLAVMAVVCLARTGSGLVTCGVGDSSREYTHTAMFVPGESDACGLRYDVDTPSWGYFAFAPIDPPVAIYLDQSSPAHNTSLTMSCATFHGGQL